MPRSPEFSRAAAAAASPGYAISDHGGSTDEEDEEENVESNMPQVLDYVQQKAEQFELERSLTAWQRKVDIAEMEHKRYSGIARKGGLVG